MSIWSSLDELAGKVADNAGKLVDSVVDARIKATSDPPIAKVPNATAVSDTSRAPTADPNSVQKWALIGFGTLLLVGVVAWAATRGRS